jgi:hypothetical protein
VSTIASFLRFASLNPDLKKAKNAYFLGALQTTWILFVLPYLRKPDFKSVKTPSIHPQILVRRQILYDKTTGLPFAGALT